MRLIPKQITRKVAGVERSGLVEMARVSSGVGIGMYFVGSRVGRPDVEDASGRPQTRLTYGLKMMVPNGPDI